MFKYMYIIIHLIMQYNYRIHKKVYLGNLQCRNW